jgi:hypothetical protein
MKNKLLLLIIFPFMFFANSCEKPTLQIEVPSCIEKKINGLEKNKEANIGASVWQWEVDGKKFFYFVAPCCDQLNELFSSSCERICAPDGGITGEGDGNCPDFDADKVETLVWQAQ